MGKHVARAANTVIGPGYANTPATNAAAGYNAVADAGYAAFGTTTVSESRCWIEVREPEQHR